VHQIEISSRCNLACGYCPHPGLQREKGDMDWEMFNAAIEWAAELGGPELSLTGMGEALLHPLFVPMLRRARERLPGAWLLLATNGVVLTRGGEAVESILHALRVVGATVFVSTHRPEVAGPAIDLLRKAGVKVGTNDAFVTSGFDWAGQVEWHGLAAPKSVCQYIAQGWATVLQDGTIVNCCMDAHGLHPIGNVNDAVKPTRIDPIPLCTTCHLEVPR
jgi:hypothetical protein